MNQKKVKWLRKLVSIRNPALLLLIRNKYGEETQGMDYHQLFKKAKKLYKNGEIQKVNGWPTLKEVKETKRRPLFDAPLIRKPTTNQ
ncbi:hypothetical protein KAR91_65065 [Candidatus Pacearchaeota archaeon]|nr:hypothetical protein [Candidatus Pacearchaeota archaeon]